MRKRKILLRFDDICPTMNWGQWYKAKRLLDENGATALLGVIPDNQDLDLLIDEPRPDFWDYIKQLKHEGYIIAMHGYQHIFDVNANGIVTRKCAYNHSEFAGHSYDVQYKKIRKGKEILLKHGIETDIFFAPAHAYDDNTLRALAANGFRYISDGKSNKPYMRYGIICVPARSSGIAKMRFGIYHTAILHAHEWVREDKKVAWEQLQNIIKNQQNELLSFYNYANRPLGNVSIQKFNENLYLIWESQMRPYARTVLKILK